MSVMSAGSSKSSNKLELEIHNRAISAAGTKHVRAKSFVPGIIYGGTDTNVPFYTDYLALTQIMSKGHFYNKILPLKLDGKTIQVLPKSVQTHPQNDRILHVDMLMVNESSVVKVKVPVRAEGIEQSTAIKQGAILSITLHSIEVHCKVADIPAEIVIDVKDLRVGQNVHVSALSLDKKVKILTSADQVILAIAGRDSDDESSGDEESASE